MRPVVHKLLCCWLLLRSLTGLANPKLLNQIDHIRQQAGVAATAVILVDANRVLIDHHLGVTDHHSQQPFTAGNFYRIGSISKSFAGQLALRLEAADVIDLSAPVTAYGLGPYLHNTHPSLPITLSHLLEHSAGLRDLAKAEWDHNTPGNTPLKARFALQLGEHQTLWPPGLHKSYSNVGYGLFGLALALQTGKSYESLMAQHVFKPLRMNHSGLLLTPEVSARLITGYDRDATTPIPYWHNIYRPFAAINTQNQDMVRWLQALLQDDSDWLDAAQRMRWQQPTTTLAARHGLAFGYGLGVYQWQTQGHDFWGHGGDADGYLTRFGIHPASGKAYFIMINAFQHHTLQRMVELLETEVIGDQQPPSKPSAVPMTTAALQAFVGTYESVTSRFSGLPQPTLTIRQADAGLSAQRGNGPVRLLVPVGQNLFRRPHETTATMGFFQHQGRLYYQGHEGNFVKQSAPRQTED